MTLVGDGEDPGVVRSLISCSHDGVLFLLVLIDDCVLIGFSASALHACVLTCKSWCGRVLRVREQGMSESTGRENQPALLHSHRSVLAN